MSLFLRVFQHLLPDSPPWQLTITKTLRKFFDGLTVAPQAARDYADQQIWTNLFPATCEIDALAEWEREFGIVPDPVEANRRLALAAEWQATGGQSPSYLQGVIQTAGFTGVFVHEWWSSGPPYVARDPTAHTLLPLIADYQCTSAAMLSQQPQCGVGDFVGQPQCGNFLANNPGYLVNLDLSRRPPPRVPTDSAYWPFFIYFGAATFPNPANVPAARRAEFERLLLKLRPAQQWIVTLINYV